MKNIFKKAILPLLVFGIAIAGVFATNSSMVLEQPSQPLHTGPFLYYDLTIGECIEVFPISMDCTLVNTLVKCTWETVELVNGVQDEITEEWTCTVPLYKRTTP